MHCVRQQADQLGAPGPTRNSEPAAEFMISLSNTDKESMELTTGKDQSGQRTCHAEPLWTK